jgi:probable F420-dependent oxidoreductase
MAVRPFRFGVGPAGLHGHEPHATAKGWAELARRMEDAGFSAINVGDHLDDRLGPIAALAAAGCATSRLRLGVFMLANDYRHPAVLAKELATLDALSGGRLEIGIGAGWLAADYEQAGLTFDPPATRIERLAEAVTVLKLLLSGGEVEFAGEHYQISGLCGLPEPVQRPHPPLALGGGSRRILSLAAREADILAFNVSLRAGKLGAPPGQDATAGAVEQKVAWVRQAAKERYEDIESQVYVHVVEVTPDRHGAAERIGARLGMSAADVLGSPHVLVGSTNAIADDLQERRERFGFSYISMSATAMDDIAPVVGKLVGR